MTLDEIIKSKNKKNPMAAIKEAIEKEPITCLCLASTALLGFTVLGQNAKIAQLSAQIASSNATHWNNTCKAAGALQAVADRLEPTFPGIEKEMVEAALSCLNEKGWN